MDAAICATCSGECVRAFLAYGTQPVGAGQISMRRAMAGVMETGSIIENVTAEIPQSHLVAAGQRSYDRRDQPRKLSTI